MPVAALVAALLLAPAATSPAPETLDVETAAARLAPRVEDREGWARDVLAAFARIGRPPAAADVCLVFAVIDGTSGFTPGVRLDRTVPFDFSARLERTYGAAVARVTSLLLRLPDPASGRPFAERFAAARTEAAFDAAFLDLLAALRARVPALYATAERLAARRGLSLLDLDPVHTLGPMQVSLRWAAASPDGAGVPPLELRARLHSRAGGIDFGVARLFAGGAAYDDVDYRIADYNAGLFASRNAAFQELVARLAGEPLALDGDLLRYDARGSPEPDSATLGLLRKIAPGLDPPLDAARLRLDLANEKSLSLELTVTWRAVRSRAARALGGEPRYARLPHLRVRGPKQRASFSVREWVRFTRSAYDRCLSGGALPARTSASSATAASAQPPAAKKAAAGERRSQSAPKRRLAPSAP